MCDGTLDIGFEIGTIREVDAMGGFDSSLIARDVEVEATGSACIEGLISFSSCFSANSGRL
jgi:hypothetical protein